MGRSNSLVINKLVDLLLEKDETSRLRICTFICDVFSFFKNHGYVARFVGGCVRDYILNIPIKDIDIATDMPVELMFEKAKETEFLVIPTGVDFGTLTFIFDDLEIQITTLREDVQTDGRKAVVKFTDSFEKDSLRRDFSFNALYMDQHGNIFDFHNGINDLKAKRIRFIGVPSSRIQEDYLRIFRYFRFWGKYASSYEDRTTIDIIFSLSNGIDVLSGERIFQETIKILDLKNANIIINLMMPLLEKIFNFSKNTLPVEFSQKISLNEKFIIFVCGISDRNSMSSFLNRLKVPNLLKKQCIIFYEIYYARDDALNSIYLKYSKDIRLLFLNLLSECCAEKYEILSKLESNVVYEFDITGKDVIDISPNIDKTRISNILKECKKFWIDSVGTESRRKCIQFILDKILCTANE